MGSLKMSDEEARANKYYGKGPGYDPVSVPNGGELKAENIFDKYKDKFSSKALEALETKAHQLVYEYNDANGLRQFAVAKFLGIRVNDNNIEEAVEILVSKINLMADNGFIIAALAPMIIIELKPTGLEEDLNDFCNLCIVSYVNLNSDGCDWLDVNLPHLSFQEGGVPRTLGN